MTMSETLLLDANLLIALSFADHVHHYSATRWFAELNPRFATCPITQAALVRYTVRSAVDGVHTAERVLASVEAMPGHEFWPDDISCSSLPWKRIAGYRQITDAYLVSLARHHGGRLATLDKSLAAVFPEALCVPGA